MSGVEIVPDLPENIFIRLIKFIRHNPPLQRVGIIGGIAVGILMLVSAPLYLSNRAAEQKLQNSKNSGSQDSSGLSSRNNSQTNTQPQKSEQSDVKAAGGLSEIIIDDTKPIKDGIVPMTNDCVTITYHENPPNGTVFMQWKMDSGNWTGWTPLSRPCVLSGLSQGAHRFSIQLKDNFNNLSPLVVRAFTLVDKTPPKVIKISGISNGQKISTNSVCISVSATDNTGSSVQIRNQLDANGYSTWSNNTASCYTNLSNGTHTITTQSQDNSQNVSTTTTVFTVSIPDNPIPTLTPTPTPEPQFSPLTPTPFTTDPIT